MVAGGGFEPPKLSRQIYSLIPLAARESRHIKQPLNSLLWSELSLSRQKTGVYSLRTAENCQHNANNNNAIPEKLELARGVEPPTG